MNRCEHYDLDCEQEERTCEGCAYNKKEKEIGELHIGGMVIKTKYQIGQRVWVVAENEKRKEIELFSDTIVEICITRNREIVYILDNLCDEVKENNIIPYEDTESLLQEILDIDNRLYFEEENK